MRSHLTHAFNSSPLPVARRYTEGRLLNYLTTPNVLVWSAAVASCAIPGVFAPVELKARGMNGEVRPYFHQYAHCKVSLTRVAQRVGMYGW
jgi:predicted acylesterase/phospholipase RssA